VADVVFRVISAYCPERLPSTNIFKYIKHMTSKQQFPDISRYFQIFPDISRYFQIFPDISRYFQIFPDISRYFPYSTRVVFAEGAERWALAQRHPTVVRHLLSGTWSRMGLKRYALGQKPVRLT